MKSEDKPIIMVQATINLPVEKVWKFWTNPQHIVKWNNASDDWHSPHAENDLRPGGKFTVRMEAKDGSTGFDFGGVYDKVTLNEEIDYTLGDGRKVKIAFTRLGNRSEIIESFEAENTNPVEMQRNGWQSILYNFKKYAEMTSE